MSFLDVLPTMTGLPDVRGLYNQFVNLKFEPWILKPDNVDIKFRVDPNPKNCAARIPGCSNWICPILTRSPPSTRRNREASERCGMCSASNRGFTMRASVFQRPFIGTSKVKVVLIVARVVCEPGVKGIQRDNSRNLIASFC